jgi:prepilin-type N-terminal cleavage/methylation domain-containing protein
MTHLLTPPQPVRSGYTLIEMLLVITVLGVLSAMGAVLIGLLMSAESRGTEGIVVQTTFSRLGRQLRADVHAAESADVVAVGEVVDGRLNLQLEDGGSVHYIAEEGQIVREFERGNDDKLREEYLFPEGTSRFVADGAAGVVRLEHLRPYATETETGVEGLQRVPLRLMQIEAALGLDRRHQIREGHSTDVAR